MYSKHSHSQSPKSLWKSLKSTARLERKHIMAALKFNERHQGESEGFESIVTDLKILVKDCAYHEEERMVSAPSFSAASAQKFAKCLDLAKELTLEKAVEIGRNHEKNLNSLKKLSKGEPNCECHRKEETSKTNAWD